MDDIMAEPPEKRTTVDEFLRWDDGTDTRYELIDGRIVAMAPPGGRHGTIVVNIGTIVNTRLRSRPPCRAQAEAGVRISENRWWQADLAVTCGPPEGEVVDPRLIIEVLSPSTRSRDLADKLPDYKDLPSVNEIWLIDSERRWAQIWWREPDGWHGRDHVGGGTFRSLVLEGDVALDELYLNADL